MAGACRCWLALAGLLGACWRGLAFTGKGWRGLAGFLGRGVCRQRPGGMGGSRRRREAWGLHKFLSEFYHASRRPRKAPLGSCGCNDTRSELEGACWSCWRPLRPSYGSLDGWFGSLSPRRRSSLLYFSRPSRPRKGLTTPSMIERVTTKTKMLFKSVKTARSIIVIG
jgi:hypothetical protein